MCMLWCSFQPNIVYYWPCFANKIDWWNHILHETVVYQLTGENYVDMMSIIYVTCWSVGYNVVYTCLRPYPIHSWDYIPYMVATHPRHGVFIIWKTLIHVWAHILNTFEITSHMFEVTSHLCLRSHPTYVWGHIPPMLEVTSHTCLRSHPTYVWGHILLMFEVTSHMFEVTSHLCLRSHPTYVWGHIPLMFEVTSHLCLRSHPTYMLCII